jgi:hypothetical protein
MPVESTTPDLVELSRQRLMLRIAMTLMRR